MKNELNIVLEFTEVRDEDGSSIVSDTVLRYFIPFQFRRMSKCQKINM